MKWVFCFYTKTPCLSYTILQVNHNKHLMHKLKQNHNFPTSFNLYTKGRLKQKIQTAFKIINRIDFLTILFRQHFKVYLRRKRNTATVSSRLPSGRQCNIAVPDGSLQTIPNRLHAVALIGWTLPLAAVRMIQPTRLHCAVFHVVCTIRRGGWDWPEV